MLNCSTPRSPDRGTFQSMVALVLLDTSEGASHGSRITSMANRHSDSDHPPDLAIRRAARLSVRHDFHAFSALRSADLRPATLAMTNVHR